MSNRDRDDDRRSRGRDDDDRPRRRDDDDRGSRSRSRDDDRDEGRSRSRDRDDDRRRSDDRDSDRHSSRRRDNDDDRGSRRGGSRYEYKSRDTSALRKRQSMGANEFDKFLKSNIKMWKPNDGDNRIRVLPPTWEGADHYGLDIYMHYGVGPDRQSYLCPDKHDKGPCPICEERLRVRDDGDEEYAKELEPKRRVLVYQVDRDHPKDGVQAWAQPWGMDRDITKISEDKGTGEVLSIDHPEDGYDVEFEKKGQGKKTEYLGIAIARRSSPLGKDEWLDFAVDNPLPDQLVFFDYDDIAKAFRGQGSQRGKSSRDDDDRGRGDDRRSRDRDDRDSPRSSRDDDRGSDDRRESRRDRDDDRGSDRGGSSRDRGRSADPDKPTWESVHDMTQTELEDLIDNERLDIDPKDAKDVEDLADWICEEMKLKKAEPEEGRRRRRTDDEDEDKLRDMRRRRED